MTLVTVFGGTGFLGRRIAQCLTREGMTVRVAVRHPERVGTAVADGSGQIIPLVADVRNETLVATAIASSDGVVNAVSAYVEKGGVTYRSVHVQGAANVAKACDQLGVARLVHISGIGADAASRSRYIRSRGQGEEIVRQIFPAATILRPSVMFASDDGFLQALLRIARSTPMIPLVGGGITKMQPIHVSDVAKAVRLCLRDLSNQGRTYEIGGPEQYTLREIIEMVVARTGHRRLLVPLPFGLAHPLAWLLEYLPDTPLTVAQVDLLARDNIPGPSAMGTQDLGFTPRSLKATVARLGSV
jgi:NADH dehydrogenase